jgi:O-methyltransferase domain/Dimerisation domain
MSCERADSSASALLNLVEGHRITAVIYTAAELGIADLLFEGPKTVAQLAHLTGTHERSLRRLLRALVTLAICTETADGNFDLTELGTHLASNSDRSLKAVALLEGGMLRARWGELIESIRTGKTADELAGLGQERFEVIAKTKDAGLVNEAMASMTRSAVPDILSAYDFSGVPVLMDVGGGIGELMGAVLKKHPTMRGIVFDLPHCAEAAVKNVSEAGVADRFEFIAGSFFEPLPSGADAIMMKSIIHDWSDERCIRILRNCRRVLKRGARLIVIDRVVPDELEPTVDNLSVVMSDLNMLGGIGGCERPESEFRDLLAMGGFHMKCVVPTGRYGVIEASAD